MQTETPSNKHMTRVLAPLFIRKMQMKTTITYPYTPNPTAKISENDNSKYGQR